MLSSVFRYLVLLLSTFEAIESYAAKIVIDPGHGGYDHGAVYGTAQESIIVLDISNRLATLLKTKSFEVDLTRTHDEFVSLKERVSRAQKQNGEIFVSLHANASVDRKATGVEFFLNPQKNKKIALPDKEHPTLNNSEWDTDLSKKKDVQRIVYDLTRSFGFKRSLKLSKDLKIQLPGNIKQAPFYVLTQTQMPSVLIEVGFLSHPKDQKKLLNLEYRQALSEKIADAIAKYLASNTPDTKYLDAPYAAPR